MATPRIVIYLPTYLANLRVHFLGTLKKKQTKNKKTKGTHHKLSIAWGGVSCDLSFHGSMSGTNIGVILMSIVW